MKDNDLDMGDVNGNMDNEFSSLINAKVMNTSQVVQEEVPSDVVGMSVATNGGFVLGVLEEVIRVGQAMGYSMKGCEKDVESIIENQGDEAELTIKNKLNFIAIQETKMDRVSHMDVKFMWGNSNYDFVCSDSLGNYGGILCIWEATVFKKDYVTISDSFVSIYGTWLSSNAKILFVAIYAPQHAAYKWVLWDYLLILLGRWNGEAILMGDFNEVRSRDERRGPWFNPSSARVFDHFISSSGLVDVKMEGYAFTWSHPSATKMSKLDRFLVSDGFDEMVEQTWRSFSYSDRNEMIRFKKKLQELKSIIRHWIKEKRAQLSGSKRHELKHQHHDIKVMEVMDSLQKSKVRWAIEGDENSKFFHGIINKKRSQLAIHGEFVDGIWHNDPRSVKEAFHNHYEARFKKHTTSGLKLNFIFPKRLLQDQVVDLERKYWEFVGPDFCEAVEHFFVNGSFSNGCNSSFIALIPKVMDAKFVYDYRPISLIGSVYKVVTKYMANRLALVIADIVSDTHSAFVAERQILDGPFILNEVLHWCKRKNKKAMFGLTWCNWIRGTFCFVKASILVNGSPSNEFHCGLKQGDPLSPYLFILVMESLHLSFSRAVDEGLFTESSIGCSITQNQFRYLGVMVGECMSRHKAWVDVVLKLRSHISKWKAKTLSIGGRLTLLKSVLGASLLYSMSIFKVPRGVLKEMESIRNSFFNGAEPLNKKIMWAAWDKVLASKKKGGLGISSFYALNRALLLKWVWGGVTLESSNCPLCLSCEEDVHHVFFQCDLARAVLRRVCRWWDLDWPLWSSFSGWYSWFSPIRLSSKVKSLLEGVFCVAWWSIWILRNRTIFDDNPPTRSVIFDDIVSFSFYWCHNRCKMLFSWEAWLKNPYLISL
nr:RNA-directed DNA polymerase, eukaryota [Tanacetum cinerariifolium]